MGLERVWLLIRIKPNRMCIVAAKLPPRAITETARDRACPDSHSWGQLGSCRPQMGPYVGPRKLVISDMKSNCVICLAKVDGVDHEICLNAEYLLHTIISIENDIFYTTMVDSCFSRSVCLPIGPIEEGLTFVLTDLQISRWRFSVDGGRFLTKQGQL